MMEIYVKTTLAHFKFLDKLRESGVINMWAAGEYLIEEFDMSQGDARRVLTHWMDTFSERQANVKDETSDDNG